MPSPPGSPPEASEQLSLPDTANEEDYKGIIFGEPLGAQPPDAVSVTVPSLDGDRVLA